MPVGRAAPEWLRAQCPAEQPGLWLAGGSLIMNYGTYGLALPHSGPSARWPGRSWAFSLTVSAAIFGYLVISGRGSNQSWPGNRSWLRLAITGMIVFFLGYSIFLVSARILFTSTGINNRVAIAGSLGFAISVVAAIGWVAGLVGRRPARKLPVYSFLVGLLCYSSLLLVNALGGFWAESWRDQQRVLADIEAHLPPPDKGSAVIIDGVCPYIGPAIVSSPTGT